MVRETYAEYKKKREEARKRYEKTFKGKDRKRRYRTSKAKNHFRKFMSWDGEGTGENTDHRYTLLVNSNNQWWYDEKGISTEDAFYYLTETAKQFPGYTHVAFASGYDVNMMLKDLPREALERLHKTGKVYWKEYDILYHPKKYLELKRYKEHVFIHKAMQKKPKPIAHIVLWDVFGFFQSSFLHAMDTFFSEEEKKQLSFDKIKEGKDLRGTFTEEEMISFVLPYCQLEVTALTKLMDRLYNEYCLHAGIVLKRFDGAGSIAQSLLTTYKIKDHYGQIPDKVMKASQHAYGGGRIELLQYGHYEGLIFHDDINSAYPSEMIKLLSLAFGKWKHHRMRKNGYAYVESPMSLYLVEWNFDNGNTLPFYPFFYRSFQGAITFPNRGLNWVWTPEFETAMKWQHVLKGDIRVLEQWEFVPEKEVFPYEFVHEMYERRRQLKAQGNGMEKVYKLGYNSFYGKTVQHLGYEDHKEQGDTEWRPPFFQLQYGGMITSGTRAKLFDAAMQHPESIIGFATDGYWSTKDIEVTKSDLLGEWEHEELQEGTFVQSGVYWTHKTTSKKQKEPCPIHGDYCELTEHYRGIDKGALKEQEVLQAWQEGKPSLIVPSTRFITLGMGLQLKDETLWHTWYKSNREIDLHPVGIARKRLAVEEGSFYQPAIQLVPTIPNSYKVDFENGHPVMSLPFPLPWSIERQEYDKLRHDKVLQNALDDACEDKYL